MPIPQFILFVRRVLVLSVFKQVMEYDSFDYMNWKLADRIAAVFRDCILIFTPKLAS